MKTLLETGGAKADSVLFVYITVGDAAEAGRIAEALVSERLAACANIVPGVHSVYRWRGAVERADEVVLIAKTRADRFDALCGRVRALHSYETPCIVAWPMAGGFPPFLEWVREESAPDAGAQSEKTVRPPSDSGETNESE